MNTDADYKNLIGKLRQKDGCSCECLEAADAIETLLAERDAAMEYLRAFRMCSACKNSEGNKKNRKQCIFGSICTGQYWEWRGEKGENHD